MDKNHFYSYKITRDYGFAPNPFYGVCSLANCKPIIRKNAQIGDWILGFGSVVKGSMYAEKLIFAMKVDEKIRMDTYWQDERFQVKKPVLNGSKKQMYGDNIYYPIDGGKLSQCNSHHSYAGGEVNYINLNRDLGGVYVLLGQEFYYWGAAAVEMPENLRILICGHGCRNCKKISFQERTHLIDEFLTWIGHYEKGRLGDPHHFNSTFKRYDGK
jgi:hypothetical protein